MWPASAGRPSPIAASSCSCWAVTWAGGLHACRFHRRIAELASNPIALAMLDRLWDQIQVSTLQSLGRPGPPPRPRPRGSVVAMLAAPEPAKGLA
jgi:hypothetical protein